MEKALGNIIPKISSVKVRLKIVLGKKCDFDAFENLNEFLYGSAIFVW